MDAMQQDRQIDVAAATGPEQVNYRDVQVKGRVVTTMQTVPGGDEGDYQVKQVIDGHTMYNRQFMQKLSAAEEYAWLRATARRNLHEYLSDAAPDSYQETH